MNDLYKYRVNRFDNIVKSWKLKRMHDLMVNYKINADLLYELKQAVMLYISKAFYFNYFEDENKFLKNLKDNISCKDNITPNGAVVPKKEYQLEYNIVLRTWAKVVGFIIKDDPTLLSKYRMTPNIRIKIPVNTKPDKRKLDTAWPHSDAWVEGPWGMNCYTPLIGDVDNNNLLFWELKNTSKFSDKFLNTSSTYEQMQWVLSHYKKAPNLAPVKGNVHISDYSLIHATNMVPKCGLRISIDTTIFVGDHNVHPDRAIEYSDKILNFGEDVIISTNKSISDKIYTKKKSIFSHYTTGNLKLHDLE